MHGWSTSSTTHNYDHQTVGVDHDTLLLEPAFSL